MEQRSIKWQTYLRISQLREGEGEWGEIRGTGELGRNVRTWETKGKKAFRA